MTPAVEIHFKIERKLNPDFDFEKDLGRFISEFDDQLEELCENYGVVITLVD